MAVEWKDVWAIAETIESSVTEDECKFLWDKAADAKHGIIEVGSWKGRSSVILGSVAKERQIPLVCVDTWADCDLFPGQDFFAEWRDNVFRAGLGGLRSTLDRIREQSVVAAREFPYRHKAFDLLFIDADHAYESVRSDFEAWSPLLARPATVIFHDTNPYCVNFGSPKYFKELCEQYEHEEPVREVCGGRPVTLNIGAIYLP